jgi:hypothetical protein
VYLTIRTSEIASDRRAAGEVAALVSRPKVRYLTVGMRQSASTRKKPDYPEETEGSRLAAKVRKLASKLTPEEEAELFRRGRAKICGGQPKEITGVGY